ncbi:bifunctional Casein kinase II subunit beta-like/Casein kinase II [Babesia duncani]|uniref:Casein kinase II subunit beta n=1 Tax=Babesia duncani TaxID=323732 RepID=A0AAD9PL21_9APIC|nr:bifunctional Casein kinase II subunit beta-like/Casein kinase II [Babesia duncani]
MLSSVFLGEGHRPSLVMDSSDSLDTNDNDNQSEMSWIEWYCSLKGHQYFVMVDESYIRDDFNLVGKFPLRSRQFPGLQCQVSHYTAALQIILDSYDDEEEDDYDVDDEDEEDGDDDEKINGNTTRQQKINNSTQMLYGLIHSRFIITNKGMQLMFQKYKEKVFGTCPNFSCENAAVLPIGIVDAPSCNTAKIFCPRCNVCYLQIKNLQEVYHPPKSSRLSLLDGAYFGTTFAHLFLMLNTGTVCLAIFIMKIPSMNSQNT